MKPIRILVAEDEPIIREGLRILLSADPDLEVIATASNGQEAVQHAVSLTPDIVLMDIHMPVLDGISAVREIKQHAPSLKIIMLTGFQDEQNVVEALITGASGYLVKDLETTQLIAAIKQCHENQLILPGSITSALASRLALVPAADAFERDWSNGLFSPREREVASWLSTGADNQQISHALFLSMGTVKNYVSGIYKKLGRETREEAVTVIRQMMKQA
ncbi:response regulator transcription factor [Brevibacillus ruminantium]|uniref:Response regulator transcription factor n=1 Tax=Brevibacillus ruminantium TaxID=2950604 RepID=A0ABY4WIF7_9BACL|nr:response regulator transcription factor [Brevibacillus ruminantium]USG66935.1 response regulator transcription factor [Brevibacillus ruminantium]